MLLNNYKNQGNKSTRLGFGNALLELGQQKSNIVALCADLTTSLCMDKFANKFSHRFFQIGIAEANMMGIAAGLSIGGFIPFTGTFANFATSRVYDQIRQSICYSKKNVKICASHAGISLGEDGATHQSLEDIGLMKMLPQMVVINTCDYNQTYLATFAIADYNGPVYLRFGRPAVPNFTDINQKFEIGKAQVLISGHDVTIVATGHLVWEAIEAAHELYKEGISSEVINIHTIKPLDQTTILTSVSKTNCLISAEEHNYWGGMGESIARILTHNMPIPQEFISINDSFGESGTPEELMEKYNINKKIIKKKVKLILKRKINK